MELLQQACLEAELASYIRAQNLSHQASAIPLSPAEIGAFANCFSALDLGMVRIADAAQKNVAEPAFCARLRELGIASLPSFSLLEAVTFDNVIVAHLPIDNAVLFHECVHVTQYRLLGVERFAVLYVRGFLASAGYEGIPLEICARELASRYAAGERSIDVEAEVLSWRDAERF